MQKLPFVLLIIFQLVLCSCFNQDNKNPIPLSEQSDLEYTERNKSYSCDDLPDYFSTYDEAKEIVEGSTFRFAEHINTEKSSWIDSASFFSCDRKTGYFIFRTKGRAYIYEGMPLEIWEGFKQAPSYGSYYNKHIKGRYILHLQ